MMTSVDLCSEPASSVPWYRTRHAFRLFCCWHCDTWVEALILASRSKMSPFLYTLAIFASLASASAAQLAPLIVFGDSTVDVGNNNYINTSLDFKSDYPPHGQHFFGRPTGRFCDGRIFVDFLCDSLGIPHTLPALQPKADHRYGVNFASGGAGVLPETNKDLAIPLWTQVKYFTEFQEAVYKNWESDDAKKYFSDAIYLISIANNDYMAGYFNIAELRERFTPQDFVALIVSELVKACEVLRSMGARKLVVLEVGPFGCVPALRHFHPAKSCFQPGVDLAVAHNHALRLALKSWESSHSDVVVLVAGLHQFMLERIENPTAFGFNDGVAACCGIGELRAAGHCGRPNPYTGEAYETCEEPDKYVFWDFYHATEKVHEAFAKWLWDGPPDAAASSPTNLRKLADFLPLSSESDGGEDLAAISASTYAVGQASPLDVYLKHSVF